MLLPLGRHPIEPRGIIDPARLSSGARVRPPLQQAIGAVNRCSMVLLCAASKGGSSEMQMVMLGVALAWSVFQVPVVDGRRGDSYGVFSSSLLSAELRETGRSPWVSCTNNATICQDKSKNPYGGTTCCGKRLCRDLQFDSQSCGTCFHQCDFGSICCRGKCVETFDDMQNCGKCGFSCPANFTCNLGLCGYDGSDD